MSAIKDLREIADVVKEAADFLGTITEQLPRQPLVDELGGCAHWLRETAADLERPIDMVLHCPRCGEQHIDEPEPRSVTLNRVRDSHSQAWANPPHRTHLCHSCGHRWRPADVATNGVTAVKTRGKDDDPIVTPKPRVPDWDAIKDKRMCELTPEQRDDAQELWVRKHVGYFTESVEFLLRRLDEARGVK